MRKSKTALILCGGKGERLKPLTEHIPKPLIKINNKSIISYILDYIRNYEIDNVVIAAGYQSEKIIEYFNNNHHGFKVTIVESGDVDIIERIKACAHHIDEDFFMFYGDTLADVDLDMLYQFHKNNNSKATITVWPLKSQFGLAQIDEHNNIINFREKPTLDEWINIGFFYYDHEVLSWLKEFISYADFLEYLGKNKKLKGYKHNGIHITVNTLRELEDAENNIHHFNNN
jgi:glucose-1-phosphate cytidylyltransferase